ncbi:WLM domain-containing protein [Trichoderma barbatum]
MPEHDPLVLTYSHLAQFRRADEALNILKKVASLVKPIMRNRGWKVGELVEFYPNQQNLLGLNVNRGMRICLRLRYPQDQNQFLPTESVVDTMLHELCHIVHGPHDAKFHALWDQLRDEWQGLLFKGYTGEGFLSEGHRLGGRQALPPPHEVQRLARAAAEKRKAHDQLTRGSGQRLGGGDISRPPRPGRNLRQAVAAAAEKRTKALEGCATEKLSENEIRVIADTASKNGFRTQAEEDEANDLAIAQALWEVAQGDDTANLGGSYVTSSPAEKVMAGNGNKTVSFDGSRPSPGVGSSGGNTSTNSKRPVPPRPGEERFWICSVCTLHNPQDFLCCDACGVERGEATLHIPVTPRQPGPRPAVIDLTDSPPKKKAKPRETLRTAQRPPASASGSGSKSASAPAPALASPPSTWRCEFCTTQMDRQWWTCSNCGQMKFNSR